jgi:hypothetical protein
VLSASSVNRSCVSLLLGALAWTINLWSAASLEHAEVFAWVADRDADCVVALDSALMELESWVVNRPTALLVEDGAAFVQSSLGARESWSRLESGSPPIPCSARVRACALERSFADPQGVLQGEPTAWACADLRSLVATPGAVHLFTEGGSLERVQGGFSWVSAVALSRNESVVQAD